MNVLVVYKKSSLELYSDSSDEKLQEFMESNNVDIEVMRKSHDSQKKALEKVLDNLEKNGIDHSVIYRADLEKIRDKDLVVSVGGDGTFLEVSHYVKGTPVLGVNSDPMNSVGYYCCFDADNFYKAFDSPKSRLNRLEILINGDKIEEPILNDFLFAHPNPASTTRYKINGEEHKNSGLLVATAAGSTAWIYQENGTVLGSEDNKIQYLNRGERGVKPCFADEMQLESLTRKGQIYIDGPHLTYDLTLGDILEVRKGEPLLVYGNIEAKRRKFAEFAKV